MRKIVQGIYLITNKTNNKKYVGQSIDIYKRWNEHRNPTKNAKKYHLYKSIEKNGIDKFKFEILEIIGDRNELTNKEQYWYDKLKPEYCNIEPREYLNLSSRKPVFQIEKDTLTILKKYESVREATRQTGIFKNGILSCCKKHKHYSQAGSYYWCFVDEYESWEPQTPSREKPVAQILNGNIVSFFKSLTEANKKTDINYTSIWKCCNNKKYSKTAGGYIWKYQF